ncbi:MAG: TetR/AcrR family transcriptional regulator [Acidobacteriota bacterium]
MRQKILSAATELFLQNGFETVSMRKIAEKIEYAPSTIYLYFEDKDEICSAIGTEAFEILTRGLDENEQKKPARPRRYTRRHAVVRRFRSRQPASIPVGFRTAATPKSGRGLRP